MSVSVFYSFHHPFDLGRLEQVERMGIVAGQRIPTAQEWALVESDGDAGIRRWMVETMASRDVLLLLVGTYTYTRKWVLWEVERAWRTGQPIVAMRVHGLAVDGRTEAPGPNPLALIEVDEHRTLADVVPLRDPDGADAAAVHASIGANLADWMAAAVTGPSGEDRR